MSAPTDKASEEKRKAGKEIPHPRRILAVSLSQSAEELSAVIKELTGTLPLPATPERQEEEEEEEDISSLAGTTHPLPLSTPYYSATVPIWLDLVSSPGEWSASFLSDEAKEVLDVLGGIIVVVDVGPAAPPANPNPQQQQQQHQALVREVGRVVKEGLGGWEWDGVSLVVGVGRQEMMEDEVLDGWEDVCAEGGLEFVYFAAGGTTKQEEEGKRRNEYGERMGIGRVREALEANDWSGGGADEHGLDLGQGDDDDEEEDDGDKEFDPKGLGYGFDKEDFEGLKRAIWEQIGEGTTTTTTTWEDEKRGKEGQGGEEEEEEEEEEIGDDDIKNLEQMMLKLQAVRDMSAGLPEQQRKRMAKHAVEEVMREL
ncbi:hypothetical protein QBC41DRAFT_279655 [Cercophora samala]|uniref:Uncharacterized protein n=1 Tax=Cercophora samala TaxID=330535 RepID=A0AA39ZAK3_9PEZI|nr:hypothetical protein QBC41DRAFT_279655 [Cercophora samala]